MCGGREGRVACEKSTRSPLLHIPSQKYGTCRKEEEAFFRQWLVATQRARNQPPLSLRDLNILSPAVGYVITIMAATDAFYELVDPVRLATNEYQRVEAFELSTVNSMLDFARAFPRFRFPEEERWVFAIERVLAEPLHSELLTTLRARWTAAPFQAMLHARDLSNTTANAKTVIDEYNARRAADVAAHGLHPCGLPSCDQREATVKQFKYCGDCEAEWYCCAEHQVLHWKEHKPMGADGGYRSSRARVI